MRKLVLLLIMGIMVHYAHAQNRTLSGVVTSQTQAPLVGASVTVPGTNLGTVTNSNGMFSIVVPASAKSLEFSFIGHKGKTMGIGSGNSINVILEEGSVSQLDEVVVGAAGISSKKKDLGYAT